MIAFTASSAMSSGTTASTSIFGRRLTLYSCPRYTAVCPFCLPCPRTSVTVTPDTPSLPSASFTSSTLLGRIIALINFIVGRLPCSMRVPQAQQCAFAVQQNRHQRHDLQDQRRDL